MLCPKKSREVKYPKSELKLCMISQLSVYTRHSAWEEFPTGLWISQTCNRLDPAHPKLPLLMWVGSCSVRSLHGRSTAVLKP